MAIREMDDSVRAAMAGCARGMAYRARPRRAVADEAIMNQETRPDRAKTTKDLQNTARWKGV